MLAEPLDYYLMLVGFLSIFVIGSLLGKVAIYLLELFGYELADEYDVDFEKRMIDGEVLDKDNMFTRVK